MIKCTKCHLYPLERLHPITTNTKTLPVPTIDIPNKTDTPTCANSLKV